MPSSHDVDATVVLGGTCFARTLRHGESLDPDEASILCLSLPDAAIGVPNW